jgi:peptidoglycan/LPS O-acetylase OafA/YrhL
VRPAQNERRDLTEGHGPIERHGKIADIELLRGIAVIFVLIEHTRINLFPWIWGPETRLYFYFGFWSGVDLFFAISGFVITRSLLPMLEMTSSTTGFFNAALSFWVRRIWRLLPSAWLWLAIILTSAALFNRSGVFWSFRANFEGVIAALLDVANFRIAIIYGKAEPGAAFPYWSLSLEEQFYILLPIALFFAGRRLPWVLAVGILAQFFIVRLGPRLSDLGLLLNMLRSEALMMGVLLAIWSRTPSYRLFEPSGLKGRPLAGLALLTFFTFALAAVGGPGLTVVSFTVGLVALLSAALVFFASYDQDYLMPRGPWKDVMLWVGSRSYALYLVHIPAFFVTREIWFRIEPPGTVFDGAFTLRFALTGFGLLLIFTELNYRFVEVPLRRRGVRIAQRIEQRAG